MSEAILKEHVSLSHNNNNVPFRRGKKGKNRESSIDEKEKSCTILRWEPSAFERTFL